MFKYAETVPAIYPARTAVTRGSVGPVVWCESELGDTTVMCAFNSVEFWELVKTGLPLLDGRLRSELIDLIGGVHPEAYTELLVRAQAAEEQAVATGQDIDRVAEQIADRIIDLDAERAKRRPAPSAA